MSTRYRRPREWSSRLSARSGAVSRVASFAIRSLTPRLEGGGREWLAALGRGILLEAREGSSEKREQFRGRGLVQMEELAGPAGHLAAT